MTSLENWVIMGSGDTYFIVGDTVGHMDYPDGSTVKTSKISKLDFNMGFVQTKNSIYDLGVPASGTKCVTGNTKIID
jgi:hypothetical protein